MFDFTLDFVSKNSENWEWSKMHKTCFLTTTILSLSSKNKNTTENIIQNTFSLLSQHLSNNRKYITFHYTWNFLQVQSFWEICLIYLRCILCVKLTKEILRLPYYGNIINYCYSGAFYIFSIFSKRFCRSSQKKKTFLPCTMVV